MRLRRLASIFAGGALVLLLACGSSDDAGSGGASPDPGDSGASESATVGGEGGSSGSSGSSGVVLDAGGTPPGDGGGTGGTGPCSGSAADPAAAATVSGYMDKLPNNAPTQPARAQIIDAIIKSCQVFGPVSAKEPTWKREYCWAHLVAAIGKESSYNAALTIKDGYGTRTTPAGKANDPTVGLLQIRFSSTVHDFVQQGALDSLSCVGCTFPAGFAAHKAESGDSAFWAVSGPPQNAATMQSLACNVGLGAWYYYLNATGNGKPSAATYLAAYCAGQGTAADLVTGLLSHLKGPDGGKGVIATINGVNALQGTDNGAYQYVTSIKTQFDSMVGPVTGTHPFFIGLLPNQTQYCR